MKCYEWRGGRLTAGLQLTADERLGQVIFLGEAGRGRRYEKVAIGRRNPAVVVDGRVLEARLVKIILPAKDGKPEKGFFVLEAPNLAEEHGAPVIVRVNTYGGYVRNGNGSWTTLSGTPEEVISGYGAFGDAGRIGGWADGLLILRSGDALRVVESRSEGVRWVIWHTGEAVKTATLQEYENLQAVAKAEALIAEAEAEPLTLAFGRMPCSTYVGRGQFSSGIEVGKGATGPVVALGEEGRGRKLAEIPIVGSAPTDKLVEAAVAELDRKTTPARYSWEKPTTKVVYGLTQEGEAAEVGTHLVRLVPLRSVHRQSLSQETLRGAPTQIASGNFASGTAGAAGYAADGLWVMRPGDVIRIGQIWVVENQAGRLVSSTFLDWEAADGRTDPEAYIATGRAPWGQVPIEWVGRIVSVISRTEETDRGETSVDWPEGEKGELVSLNPFRSNLGWDGRDRRLVECKSGVWVKLHAELTQTRPTEDERQPAKAAAEAQKTAAEAVRQAEYFKLLPAEIRTQVEDVAGVRRYSSWGSLIEPFEPEKATTAEITAWVESAERVMREAAEARVAAEALLARASEGELWLNVEIEISTESRTTTDAFVVASDGSLVEPVSKRDNGNGRKARTTAYVYGNLPTTSLVLRHTHDNYGYRHSESWEVQNCPRELTAAQRETVMRLEEETRRYFRGVGTGWDLARVGRVVVTTVYSRDFYGAEREAYDDLCRSFSVDVAEWRSVVEEGITVVGPYRRTGVAPVRRQPQPEPEPPVEPQTPLTSDEVDGAAARLRARFGKK